MNFIKQCLTAAVLLLYLPTFAQHPSRPIKKTSADSAWNQLSAISLLGKNFEETELNLLNFREEGLEFWKMYPNDSRRYEWLYSTVRWSPVYWRNLNDSLAYKQLINDGFIRPISYDLTLDKQKLNKWELIYPSLKKDFMNYFAKNPKFHFDSVYGEYGTEMLLIEAELFEFFKLSLNKAYLKNGKFDLNKLVRLIRISEKFLENENPNKPTHIQTLLFNPLDANFISCYKEYGLNESEIQSFFESLKGSSTPLVRNWAMQRSSLFALMQKPFSFKHEAIDGRLIDLEQLRGKVVLLDFWTTSCSGCIERMPAIKAIYDKYKKQGFEVISACLNSGDETERIRKIEEKIGANWPTLMIGGKTREDKSKSLGKQIFRKYGFFGVPQLLLLNKQGKLVMLNNTLRNGDFEPIVKKLLAENYKIHE